MTQVSKPPSRGERLRVSLRLSNPSLVDFRFSLQLVVEVNSLSQCGEDTSKRVRVLSVVLFKVVTTNNKVHSSKSKRTQSSVPLGRVEGRCGRSS